MKGKQSFMTTEEVAELLTVSKWAVRRYVREKRLRAVRLGPPPSGAVRFRMEDVEAFIEGGLTK